MSRTLESCLIFGVVCLGAWALIDAAWAIVQLLKDLRSL